MYRVIKAGGALLNALHENATLKKQTGPHTPALIGKFGAQLLLQEPVTTVHPCMVESFLLLIHKFIRFLFIQTADAS